MARRKMVTRTVTFNVVQYLAVDTETREVSQYEVKVTGKFKNDDELLKLVKAQITNENLKPVQIISSEEIQTLMGMTESKFILGAEEIEK